MRSSEGFAAAIPVQQRVDLMHLSTSQPVSVFRPFRLQCLLDSSHRSRSVCCIHAMLNGSARSRLRCTARLTGWTPRPTPEAHLLYAETQSQSCHDPLSALLWLASTLKMLSAVNSTCSNGAADATAQREAPAPEYVLRAHEAQINCIAFVDSANLLLSG